MQQKDQIPPQQMSHEPPPQRAPVNALKRFFINLAVWVAIVVVVLFVLNVVVPRSR